MSDDTKAPVEAPQAPAAEPIEKPRIIENPMSVLMRGGTVSSAYQQHLDQQKAHAAASREVEEKKAAFAETAGSGARQNKHAVGGNKFFSGIVLTLKHPKDNTVLDYVECELHVLDDASLMLQMCCPDCYQRAGITDNFMIRQKHRGFELDTKRQGEIWVNPQNPQNVVTLAGTITTTETIPCPNLGCGKRFRIDDSVMRYV